MREVTLGLGGNIGDTVAHFAEALQALARHPHIVLKRQSSVYRTAPWGKTDQPDFSNMAAIVETTLPAPALLSFCLLIETAAGRRRTELWGPRTLDIDLLTFGDEIIAAQDLRIPHPRIPERAFVLVPLAEIAPDLRIGGSTVAVLRDAIDISGVLRDETGTARLRTLQAERGGR